MGRQDCSLCKNADPKYSCVWCAKQNACVYKKLCNPDQQGSEDPHNTECPNPQITDVSSYYTAVILLLNFEQERCIKGLFNNTKRHWLWWLDYCLEHFTGFGFFFLLSVSIEGLLLLDCLFSWSAAHVDWINSFFAQLIVSASLSLTKIHQELCWCQSTEVVTRHSTD